MLEIEAAYIAYVDERGEPPGDAIEAVFNHWNRMTRRQHRAAVRDVIDNPRT